MNQLYPWQQEDWARLQTTCQRLPQALLLRGSAGIGKLQLATQFARALLCQHPQDDGHACGVCAACRWFGQGAHPDFRLLQPGALSEGEEGEEEGGKSKKKPSKQIKIEQIRDLADFVSLSAHQGGRRVVLIHPAESMNGNAANALLKMLEEPPADLLFILVTHQYQQLLPTILSRCLAFPLAVPDAAVATAWLQQQGVAKAAETLAIAGFSPLQAQAEAGEHEQRDKLLAGLRQPSRMDVFAITDSLLKVEQVRVVHWLQQWCYDLLRMQHSGSMRYHLADQARMLKMAVVLNPFELLQWQKQLATARREALHTLNPKLFFESLLLNYVALFRRTTKG